MGKQYAEQVRKQVWEILAKAHRDGDPVLTPTQVAERTQLPYMHVHYALLCLYQSGAVKSPDWGKYEAVLSHPAHREVYENH